MCGLKAKVCKNGSDSNITVRLWLYAVRHWHSIIAIAEAKLMCVQSDQPNNDLYMTSPRPGAGRRTLVIHDIFPRFLKVLDEVDLF